MPVAAENALEIDLVDLALHPARKSRQRVFKAARGRIERLEFVALISRESRVRDREKETLVRETCVRVPLFRACVCFPFSLSLPFPRLSLLLVYLSCLSLSLSLSLLSLSRPPPFCLRLAPTFSFSRRDKPSANVLDGRCSDGGSATRRCMSLRLCATSTLFSSLYLSLSLSLLMHTASHEQLSTSPCTRLLPCAHYVINTFTSLALSERDDAISRLSSFLGLCSRPSAPGLTIRISIVSFEIIT